MLQEDRVKFKGATANGLYKNHTYVEEKYNLFSYPYHYYKTENALKMLGLYLYTPIIGHKSCSTLTKLPLQRELQNFVKNNVCLEKKYTTL